VIAMAQIQLHSSDWQIRKPQQGHPKVLTSRQKFCAPCQKIEKKYPNELKALDAILAAFD
jgi:hypothetical protein